MVASRYGERKMPMVAREIDVTRLERLSSKVDGNWLHWYVNTDTVTPSPIKRQWTETMRLLVLVRP